MNETETGETVTVVSYNRPLTRSARRALDEYGIIREEQTNEHGHWTEVDLETEPPEDVLDRHELRVEREPDAVFRTDHGERVEIFDGADLVTVDGMEQGISPEDAREHAEQNGWDLISANADSGIQVGSTVSFREYVGEVTELRDDGRHPSAWVEFVDPGVNAAWFPLESESLTLEGGDGQ